MGPPTLTALHLLDANGYNTASLQVGGGGSLLLSALDYIPDTTYQATVAAIRAESMTVRWRMHGAATWMTLPVTVVSTEIANTPEEFAALGRAPAGTIYRAHLASVTAVPSSVDLSIAFEDAAGNSYAWTQFDAFTVVNTDRRRGVRH